MSNAKPVDDFERGYLMALSNLVALHDQPSMAADVACELGVSWRRILASDFLDYDLKSLRIIKKERNGKAFQP